LTFIYVLVGELSKTGKLDDSEYTYWDENFISKVTSPFSSVHIFIELGEGVDCSTALPTGYVVVVL
jgi:hypothetical protein